MRILMATPYIYNKKYPEFTKNKTGFGMMVNDIYQEISSEEETVLITHAITEGDGGIKKHTLKDIVKSAHFKDWLQGIRWFFKFHQPFKARIQYLYYCVNKGFVRKVIANFKPDVVHIHGLNYETKTYIEVCEEMHIPYLMTLHGLIGLNDSIKAPIWDKEYEKMFLLNAHLKNIPVSVISTGMKERIEKEYIHDATQNIFVITNGTKVCKSSFYDKKQHNNADNIGSLSDEPNVMSGYYTKKMHAEISKKYGLTYRKRITSNELIEFSETMEYLRIQSEMGRKILLYVGNISDNKNQKLAVSIVEKLDDKYLLVLLGNEMDNGLVRKYIIDHSLTNKVILAGFCYSIGEVWEIADLNLFFSINDGFGLSVIEALAHGVPSIMLNDLDAAKDLSSSYGIEIIDRNDESIIDNIKKMISISWNSIEMEKCAEQYSLEIMRDKYLKVLRNIANI